jgi:hypothetical protein
MINAFVKHFYASTKSLKDPEIYYSLGLIDFQFIMDRFIRTEKEGSIEY